MSTPRKALVVTPNLERAGLWSGWLRSAGYMSLSCVGPGLTHDCPRLRGAICPLRQAVSLAVVDVNSDPSARCCTILPDDGSTFSFQLVGSNRDQRSRLMELVAAPRVGSAGAAAEQYRF